MQNNFINKTETGIFWPSPRSPFTKNSQNAQLEAKIEEILERLSVEEKVGQMIQPEIRHLTPEDVKHYHIGSVLNGGGSTPDSNRYAKITDWLAMADAYYLASMDDSDGKVAIPIMWGTDAIHGAGNVVGATLFPHNIALGSAHNPDLIKKIGQITAAEIAVTGLDWSFSPTVAVTRDDRWGRTYESYSEHPELVRQYAGEMVTGLQGSVNNEGFLSDTQVIATAKHFIADGATSNGIDRGDSLVSEEELRDIHAAGYYSAIEAGVQTVMASFNSWHGEHLHGHKYLLTTVLKEKLGFDGLVVGDWNGHGFIAGCTPLNSPQAINAGLDIFMVPSPDWKILFHNTVAQVNSGEISIERVNDAVRRILRVKLRADLWNKGVPSTRSFAGKSELLGAPSHREVARQAVRESLVLLKNKNQLLPLSPQSTILIAGDGADNISKQTGGWSVNWQGTGNTMIDFPGATTIRQGIESAVSAAGGTIIFNVDGEYNQKPDVAIVVFGEDPYAEMQGDIPNLLFKSGDTKNVELLQKLKADAIPVVSLFITGRPLWINRELNASDAFVVVWQPGTEGAGVADVILRKPDNSIHYEINGRLTFSWPQHPDQIALNVGDAIYDPLFAYGYGLHYSDKNVLADDLSEKGIEQQTSAEILELFKRRPMGPYNVLLEGKNNDRIIMQDNYASVSTLTVTSVDRDVQEDARRVQWNGEGEGLVAISAPHRQVLTDYLHADSSLVFDVKIDQEFEGNVRARVGCGPSCYSDLDITEQFKAIINKGWQTIKIDLALFPGVKTETVCRSCEGLFGVVTEPFSLISHGNLELLFSHIYIQKHIATVKYGNVDAGV